MASRRRPSEPVGPGRKPATTPEARENEMISLATDLAEEQIRSGAASSQVVTHFLKLGSSRERLEQQRIEHENELLQAKREFMESQKRVEAMYTDALNAMRSYAGQDPIEQPDEDED
jgi:hypothetical protein